VKRHLGLRSARVVACVGDAVDSPVARFFGCLGVKIVDLDAARPGSALDSRREEDVLASSLRSSPFVASAAVQRGERGVDALVELDLPAVVAWAQRAELPFSSYGILAERPEVRALVARHVDAVNRRSSEGIARFAIVPRELSADDGELTALGAIEHELVFARFGSLLDTSKEAAA
jgi:hypothetical protein